MTDQHSPDPSPPLDPPLDEGSDTWDWGWDWGARGRPIGWGIGLILLGVAWLLVLADVDVPWDLVVPVAVIVVGVLVLVVGRRARGDGLITIGVILAVVGLLGSFVPGTLSLTAGERRHHLTNLTELRDGHVLGAGSMTLDLREIDFPEGVTGVSAGVTFGELIVRVPEGVVIAGSVRAAVGEVSSPDRRANGVAPQVSLPDAGEVDGRVLDLDLSVGFGRLEVAR